MVQTVIDIEHLGRGAYFLKGHTTNLKVFKLKLSKSYFLFRYVLYILLLVQLKFECCNQGAHAGLIRPYFHFYIYKAIRKVLFLPFLIERSYKGLIFGSY